MEILVNTYVDYRTGPSVPLRPELIGRKFHLDLRDGLGRVQTLGARAGAWGL